MKFFWESQLDYLFQEYIDCADGDANCDAPSDGAYKIGIYHEDDARDHSGAVGALSAVHEKSRAHQAYQNIPIYEADGYQ
jgi:hypothetical protein